MFGPQRLFRGLGEGGAFQQALAGRLGPGVINAPGLASALVAFEPFEGGAEVVGQQTSFLAVKVVHQRHPFGRFKPVVPEELAPVRLPTRRDSQGALSFWRQARLRVKGTFILRPVRCR